MLVRLFLFLIFIPILLVGQSDEKARMLCSFRTSKTNVKIGEEIDLIFSASIDKDWLCYSKGPFRFSPEARFTFEKNSTYLLVGDIKPINDKPGNNEIQGEYRFFEEKAEFRQKIKILAVNPQIKAIFEYWLFSPKLRICLPPFEEIAVFKKINVIKETTIAKSK